ncbi:MAG TPA: hypothetical protein VN874_11150, partial [Myxococcales bacterium]|nr:hypothetical protein [Myxococcales bacterium]
MNLPLNSGEKYALIAVEAVTDLKGEIDLGEGLFAIRGGGLRLPDDWKGWLGSLESDAIERSNLVLLAKMPSGRPTVLDAENQLLQNRTNWLFWSLLASTRVWTKGGGTQLTGGRESGEISVNQQGRMSPIVLLPGLPRVRISEAHLRRAASLSLNLCDLISRPRMRRAKWAIQTFWSAFEEGNLGERIHQFVRVVSDGFAKAF